VKGPKSIFVVKQFIKAEVQQLKHVVLEFSIVFLGTNSFLTFDLLGLLKFPLGPSNLLLTMKSPAY